MYHCHEKNSTNTTPIHARLRMRNNTYIVNKKIMNGTMYHATMVSFLSDRKKMPMVLPNLYDSIYKNFHIYNTSNATNVNHAKSKCFFSRIKSYPSFNPYTNMSTITGSR